MAIHLLRDYQNQSFTSSTGTPDQIPWILAIFCRRVLGYTVVGQTNFDLDSSTYLKASGTTAGTRAGINFGSEARYEVSIPVGVRAVSVSDVGRMLVLKSDANPRHNSGIFLITGINTTDNRYVIDWRSADTPPAEATDTMPWWLYEKDGTFPNDRNSSGGVLGEYRTRTSACSCSRVILQSPHSTGWQVRICLEHRLEWGSGFLANSVDTCNIWTAAPGFGGDSIGDFQPGGEHLHSPLWWNTNDKQKSGQQVGLGYVGGFAVLGNQEQWRISMIGDEEGHGVYILVRRPAGPRPNGTECHWQYQFGIPENEPTPLPVKPARRLFVLGNTAFTNSSQVAAGAFANSGYYHGTTMGFNGQPVTCNLASWVYVESNFSVTFNNSNNTGAPVFHTSAGDNPYTSATDVLPVDLMAGMAENWYAQSNNRVNQFEPRVMGTAPFFRTGRSTLPYFSTTSDPSNSWLHIPYGAYMMWGGPEVLP